MIDFDPGYGAEPFRSLCAKYPDESAYPLADFRVEWGPIFHRGRLDGSARLLVIGQDPAAHETFVRRILTGAAGQRCQGFLHRLGIDRSYVMINTFLYSVFGHGGDKHVSDTKIVAYRNKWLDALLVGTKVEAVVTLGHFADTAWQDYNKTPGSKQVDVVSAAITHPTFPDSASSKEKTPAARKAKYAEAMKTLLASWNAGLTAIDAKLKHRDSNRVLKLYDESATAFTPQDLLPIPDSDFPPGLPSWMRGAEEWATRGVLKKDPGKERVLSITVPGSFALPR
jgi:uracil-DNA glycosylase